MRWFFLGDLLQKAEDLSDYELDSRAQVHVVPDVTDVLVSPTCVVTEFCDGFSCCSDWEDVEPQSFSFSEERAHCFTCAQEERMYESSQVKASPISRSRMRPPTPLQNSNDAFEEAQERFVVDDQMWSARERTIIARIKQYLEERYSEQVEVRRMGRSAGSG